MERLFRILTNPATGPVSLDEFKAHLNFVTPYTREDDLLKIYLDAATTYAEDYIGYKIMSRTFSFLYRGMNTTWLELYPNVTAVTHVKYKETITDASYLTMSTDDYELLQYSPLSVIRFDESQTNDLYEITFIAGKQFQKDVDPKIKGAILLIAAKMYAKKEDSIKKMPTAAEDLLDLCTIKEFLCEM